MRRVTSLFVAALSLASHASHAQQKTARQLKIITMTTANATAVSEVEKGRLTQQERNYATKFLNETEQGVFDAVKNLSEAQLKFKPAPEKWSIEECLEHIAVAETNLWAMVTESLKQPANSEKRAEVKMTDEQLVGAVKDRAHKSKTFEALEPANAPYKTAAEAVASFKENREKLVAFVKTSNEDLRAHISALPIGTYDAYQLILLIAGHSNRHTQQIEEVKANPSFPKR
ncbi:DinB family protein [Segetibacter aerophilus]|uniref:DinB-like domain-containing protein n=1 Tax=Segetibacter aerophilus TaxID=670293 RepID=A0A512B790_9BACT|nr:DinB family protein [Segetibacter aerophilus]GEO07831.1 hypothetical protein SAE01_03270 [Segetibacter aerophilus]